MNKKLFNIIAKIFDLKAEIMELYRPRDAKNWAYSKTSDMVYQIYVTKLDKKNPNGSFGFWVHDENLSCAYAKAIEKSILLLKYPFKATIKKLFKLA